MEEKEYLPSPSPLRSNSQWATGHTVNPKSIKLPEKNAHEKNLCNPGLHKEFLSGARHLQQKKNVAKCNLSKPKSFP